jgi:diphthamide biosynthesis methyltransferase
MSLLRMPKFGPVHSIPLLERSRTPSTSFLPISENYHLGHWILLLDKCSSNASILFITLTCILLAWLRRSILITMAIEKPNEAGS